jgi:hypothetical protein
MTAWIITKDKITDGGTEGTNLNARMLIGPGIATPGDKARLLTGEGRRFRLLDDDGEIYYYGRQLIESECTEEYEEGMFGGDSELAPLDDFGRPNAGCTQIEIYDPETKKWTGLL